MNSVRAEELLTRCVYLTLWGQNEDGELEWVGTEKEWKKATQNDK